MNLSIKESIGIPTLDKIIDRNPLTVKFETKASDAIALMSQVKGKSTLLETKNNLLEDNTQHYRPKSSYVLVIKDKKIAGIFTERDLVKLIAAGIDLADKTISEVMSPNIITLKEYYDRDLLQVIAIMREHKIRHLPVVGSWGQLIGIITHENIRSALTPSCLLKMRCVSDAMNRKVVTCDRDTLMLDVAKLISEARVSCVVIVESKKTATSDRPSIVPLGIVTERDLVQFRVLELNFTKTKVAKVMSQPLFPVHLCDSLWQTLQLMRSRQVWRLVVVNDNGELAGIITQTSILKIFDPLEMSRVITVLQHQVTKRTEELDLVNQKLQQANDELEKQEQDALLQLDRQERFEIISASIARDFDRIITPILETTRILSLKFSNADRETRELLNLIAVNCQKAIDLVEQILSFSSQLDRGFLPLKIDLVLSEVMLAARATFPKSIDIVLDIPDDITIPKVLGNAIQLHEIFMNLCVNSRNAMPDGGILRIVVDKQLIDLKSELSLCRLSSAPITERGRCFAKGIANTSTVDLEPYLVITFWDNGLGMSRAIKTQIFEIISNPNKNNSAHVSGIFTVINTVKNHGGFVNIESEMGKGTLFKVYLPALEAKPI